MAIVTGTIRHVTKPSLERMNIPTPNDDHVVEEMSSRDIYKDLRLRGYNYSGMFRGVKSATLDATKGTIAWVNNWVAFMDNMLQMSILDIDSQGLFVPTGIQKLVIDTKFHLNALRASTSEQKRELNLLFGLTTPINCCIVTYLFSIYLCRIYREALQNLRCYSFRWHRDSWS